jgi:hypothetical protein
MKHLLRPTKNLKKSKPNGCPLLNIKDKQFCLSFFFVFSEYCGILGANGSGFISVAFSRCLHLVIKDEIASIGAGKETKGMFINFYKSVLKSQHNKVILPQTNNN